MDRKFIRVLRVGVPEAHVETLTIALLGFASPGWKIVVEKATAAESSQVYQELTLYFIDNDYPGLLRNASRILARDGVNIDVFSTESTSNSISGRMLFKITAQRYMPLGVVMAEFQAYIERLTHDLMVALTLETMTS